MQGAAIHCLTQPVPAIGKHPRVGIPIGNEFNL